MKLTDYSDNSAAVDIKPSDGKKTKKRKSPLFILEIIILSILLLYVAYYLLFKIMYSCNAEPFLENENLVAHAHHHSYRDSETGITYQCYTPTFEIGLEAFEIQASASKKDILFDENDKLLTDHTISITSLTPMFFGSTEYWVELDVLSPSEIPEPKCLDSILISMQISHDGELIFVAGSETKYVAAESESEYDTDYKRSYREVSDFELIEYYNKYSDEIKELMDSLHEFFGEDNFRN